MPDALPAIFGSAALVVWTVVGYKFAIRPAAIAAVGFLRTARAEDELRAHQVRCSRIEHAEGLRLPCSDPRCSQCADIAQPMPTALMFYPEVLDEETAAQIRDNWQRNARSHPFAVLSPNELRITALPKLPPPPPRRTTR